MIVFGRTFYSIVNSKEKNQIKKMDSQNELVIVEHEQIGSGTFGKVFKVRFSFIVITFLSFLYIFKLQNSR